jgi:hypothetical protein
MPHELVIGGLHRLFPGLKEKLQRKLTVPLTMTYTRHTHGKDRQEGGILPSGIRLAPYFSFDAFAGRNSAFPYLTHEQLEEIGGVEYQALCLLLWLVGGVSSTRNYHLRRIIAEERHCSYGLAVNY